VKNNRTFIISILLAALLFGAGLSGCSGGAESPQKPDGWKKIPISVVEGERGIIKFFWPSEFKYDASAYVKEALVRATGVDEAEVFPLPFGYGVKMESLPGVLFVPPDMGVGIKYKNKAGSLWGVTLLPTGERLNGKLSPEETSLLMPLFAKEKE